MEYFSSWTNGDSNIRDEMERDWNLLFKSFIIFSWEYKNVRVWFSINFVCSVKCVKHKSREQWKHFALQQKNKSMYWRIKS
jgi:hypothetical protein